MSPTLAIGAISQVLTMCGVVSIRMFLPVFLYFLSMRLALAYPDYAAEFILKMAEHTPSWQTSTPFLAVFGVLSALEIAAMRDPDIKRFLVEDLDKYAKPITAILLAGGIVSTAQSLEVRELVNSPEAVKGAAFGTFSLVMMIAAGGVTSLFCRIRSSVLEKLLAIDPEDDLGLQTISNYLGEITLLAIFFILIFLPVLSLVLTLLCMLTGLLFDRLWARHEKRHTHFCTSCAASGRETLVSDCALLCPACYAPQPDVRKVGWFGLSSSRHLGDTPQDKHAFRLLASHRCRWCGSPLNHSHGCSRCGKEQWTEEFEAFYVRRTDWRGGALLLLALLSFAFPIGGLLLALIFFRPLAVRPLSVHLSGGRRFLASLLTMFVKLLLLIPMLFLSMIPGVGLLVLLPFVLRYFYIRRHFLARRRA